MDKIHLPAKSTFFWSDTHFGHINQVRRRGWPTFEAHDQALIDRINETCKPGSTLVLLGDVSMRGNQHAQDVLEALRCRLILVRGNHDKALNARTLRRFESVHSLLTVVLDGDLSPGNIGPVARIVCCHFPMLSWDMQHYGVWHLHGHSHGSMKYPWPDALIADVGVDTWLGKNGPVGFDELSAYMKGRKSQSSDHHIPKAAA